jgi:fructose-1,6-bisphosphatase/inositol monophosphatase family enzyme
MEQYLEFAKEIAQQAGEIMLKHFKVGVESSEKEDLTLVTEADKEINDLLIKAVSEKFPEHSVLGEEKSLDNKSKKVWLCDPVDGTVPFSKGLPISVFSLAYVEDGVPLMGVVCDPFTKRMYTAIKGEGAYLNNEPIKVSDKSLDYKATMDIEWWPEAKYDIDSACHNLSMETGVYVLHLGSVIQSACMVASGQFEACIFAGTKGKSVDIAAIKVIVEEAGGLVTDIYGQSVKYYEDIEGAIISNGLIHEQLVKKLANV